jgi:pyruvate-formate lyase-activating enzyme
LKSIEHLNAAGIGLIIQTVYIPGIVEVEEIKNIASFLTDINAEMKV